MRYFVCDDTYGPDTVDDIYITKERRTFVAIEIDADGYQQISETIIEYKNEMHSHGITIDRFHFSDIFNRRGAWKGHDDLAKQTFELFSQLFIEFQKETFTQTFERYSISEHEAEMRKHKMAWPDSFFGVKTDSQESQCFTMLLFRIILSNPNRERCVVKVDQGLRSDGAKHEDSNFNMTVEFLAAENNPILQFADFAAFMINRSNVVQTRKEFSWADTYFLTFWQEISKHINCKTMRPIEIDLNQDIAPQFYSAQEEKRIENGLSPIPPK